MNPITSETKMIIQGKDFIKANGQEDTLTRNRADTIKDGVKNFISYRNNRKSTIKDGVKFIPILGNSIAITSDNSIVTISEEDEF
jgi:hypothetical protein